MALWDDNMSQNKKTGTIAGGGAGWAAGGPVGAIFGAGAGQGIGGMFDNQKPAFQADMSGISPYPNAVSPLVGNPASPDLASKYKLGGAQAYGADANNLATWAQMQGMNKGANDAAAATAGAQSQIASHGGLTGGAGERLASQGLRSQIEAGQNAGNQATANRLNISGQTHQMQQGLDSQNVANTLNAMKMQNDYNIAKNNANNQAWAAGQMAQATAAAAPKEKNFFQSIPIVGGLF